MQKILKAAIEAAPDGQSKESLESVFEWAAGARSDYAMLTLVLDGSAGMFVNRETGELTLRILDTHRGRQRPASGNPGARTLVQP